MQQPKDFFRKSVKIVGPFIDDGNDDVVIGTITYREFERSPAWAVHRNIRVEVFLFVGFKMFKNLYMLRALILVPLRYALHFNQSWTTT